MSSSGVLQRGEAWYSEALDTSPGTAVSHSRGTSHALLEKWITWQRAEYERASVLGARSDRGDYSTPDNEPGFGDWDALNVFTLPNTQAGIMNLLRSGALEDGQDDPAERTSPLIWLAQLAMMLVDDPNTPAARSAAFAAMAQLPGLRRTGSVTDALGRRGVGMVEQASDLHPVQIATGPGCHDPTGGAGCVGVGTPPGRYQLELIVDPTQQRILGIRTTALDPIPSARIKAGQTLYVVSFLHSQLRPHPAIPPLPPPPRISVQSVPWHLVSGNGRRLTIGWSSGTCVLSRGPVRPRPKLIIRETRRTVTVTVLVHVVRATGALCAGVGLIGKLEGRLGQPLGTRQLRHAAVTDHDR